MNQVRTTELASLSGLNQQTGVEAALVDEGYISTDDREMALWQASLSHQAQQGLGDEIDYSDDLDEMRSVL